MEKIIIAYVPVLHNGYKTFFQAHDADTIYILGDDLIKKVYYLSKEIRQLDPVLMVVALSAIYPDKKIKVLGESDIPELQNKELTIIMPNEDVSKIIWDLYFPKKQVILDSIFLRWDKHNSVLEKPVVPEEYVSRNDFDKKIINVADAEASRSSDWWRRVGAVVIKGKEIILQAHNQHVPSEHTPYVNGDPRNSFHKGVHIELSTSIHAEASIISEAAKRGISLQDCDLYVTTFPCPPCAKLIAYSGIKTLFCSGGYGILDGKSVLDSKGVKVIFVESSAGQF